MSESMNPQVIEFQDRQIDLNQYKVEFYENLIASIVEDIQGPDDVYQPTGTLGYYTPLFLERSKKITDLFKTLPDCIVEAIIRQEVYFNLDQDDNCYTWVICNDLFAWATADGERLDPADYPLFEQSVKDCPRYGSLLYCARKANMRPQKPYYELFTLEEAVLFDAAGPQRKAG